jgi:hypothetical protein
MNRASEDNNYIEKTLTMCKENVSPSETKLQAILSQIPEQQNLKEGRAVRSPYRWLAISQMMTVFAIVLVLLPNTPTSDMRDAGLASTNPYYEIDMEVENFEASLDQEDADRTLRDSGL